MKILKNKSGLSMVELIIALAISVIVVAAAGFILLTQSGVIRLNRSVSTEQQRLNTAFNTVRYSLRMAGFDAGAGYFVNSGSVPPLQVTPNQITYNGNYYYMPYEILATYYKNPPNSNNGGGSGICSISGQNGANLSFTPSILPNGSPSSACNIIGSLQLGDFVIISGTPSGKPETLCITHTFANNSLELQFNHGVDQNCGQNNPNPPGLPASGNIAAINGNIISMSQVLFYWGNGFKSANGVCPNGFTLENFSDGKWCTYNFNDNSTNGNEGNFNKPGNLYECTVQMSPPVIEPPVNNAYVSPACVSNTTVQLSDYIAGFSVNPLNYNPNNPQYEYEIYGSNNAFYLEYYINGQPQPSTQITSINGSAIISPVLLLSITGESNVALSDSPSYSVNVPYNSNPSGANALGNAGQAIGNNVLKTLNSNIFLRNVYYGN